MLKLFPKILITLFLSIFIVQLFCLAFLLSAPAASQAATGVNFSPQVSGLPYKFDSNEKSTKNIAEYVKTIYVYGIGAVGILAAVVLMIGGVLWIVAGGNATQISEAKAWIGAALSGLVLALASYLILSTVNPALVNLKTSEIKSVAELKTTGSCSSGEVCYDNYTAEDCEKFDGTFAQGGKCPAGRCTTPEAPFCRDNSSREKCDEQYGLFEEGKTCPRNCCAWDIDDFHTTTFSWQYKHCKDSYNLTLKDCENLAGAFNKSYIENRTCNVLVSVYDSNVTYQCSGVQQ